MSNHDRKKYYNLYLKVLKKLHKLSKSLKSSPSRRSKLLVYDEGTGQHLVEGKIAKEVAKQIIPIKLFEDF